MSKLSADIQDTPEKLHFRCCVIFSAAPCTIQCETRFYVL